MLTEYRSLVFPPDKIAAAIAAHDKVARKLGVSGEFLNVEVSNSPDLKFEAMIRGSNGQVERVELDSDYVVAAMVRFCLDNQIPLPSRGSKTLGFENGDILLRVTLAQDPIPSTSNDYYVLL